MREKNNICVKKVVKHTQHLDGRGDFGNLLAKGTLLLSGVLYIADEE